MDKEKYANIPERKLSRPSRNNSKVSVIHKRASKNLPDNFFEKILDLELKLKREFTIETLQELVAIEYYESVEDKKYKDYQNRLNLLLSQPDILKKMNLYSLKRGKSDPQTNIDYELKLRKEQERKQIKLKVDYITNISNFANNNEKVQKIIETMENNDEAKEEETRSVINEEINKQQGNFKTRLEEKKRRISLFAPEKMIDLFSKKRSNFFLNESDTNGYNHRHISNEELNGALKNFAGDETFEVDGLMSSRTRKTEKSDKSAERTERSDKSEDRTLQIEINLETSFDKFEKSKIDEIEELFSPTGIIENGALHNLEHHNSNRSMENKRIHSNSNIISSISTGKLNESFQDSKHIGPKQKQMFVEIRETLELFVDEFNYYFYEHVFQRFTEHVQKLMDEKYLKYTEISKNYHSQIKEMEFLITGDSEDQHKEGIKSIVESLKEEQEHELSRIEDHYDKLISEAQASFKNFGFKNNPGIQLIEEKFKLDMYNLINMILVPKK